jgi:hypothetical protein
MLQTHLAGQQSSGVINNVALFDKDTKAAVAT